MKKKALFIYNANAGTGKIRPHLSKIIERLCQADYDITIYATQAAGEATEMVLTRGELYETVICSGGDGTINEVVSGVIALDKKPIIGYLPTGTVNDFAKSLGIPSNPIRAMEAIVAGKTFKCDVGEFNGRTFNYVAAFGAFTEVSYETPQKTKNTLGKMAYFLDAIRLFPMLRGYKVKAYADDKYIEGEYIYGMISNSKSVGGFVLEDRKHKIAMNDGKLELILLKNPENPYDFEQVMAAMLTHTIDNNYLVAHKATHIDLEIEEPVKWTLDGESGGICDHVTVECKKEAVEIFTSRKK